MADVPIHFIQYISLQDIVERKINSKSRDGNKNDLNNHVPTATRPALLHQTYLPILYKTIFHLLPSQEMLQVQQQTTQPQTSSQPQTLLQIQSLSKPPLFVSSVINNTLRPAFTSSITNKISEIRKGSEVF